MYQFGCPKYQLGVKGSHGANPNAVQFGVQLLKSPMDNGISKSTLNKEEPSFIYLIVTRKLGDELKSVDY